MAVTLKADEIGRIVGGRKDDLPRLVQAAAARVLRYAPDAPDEIHNEAAIRLVGYLAQSDYGSITEEAEGPMSRSFVVNHADAFRRCGAAGLLAPWRTHRAGNVSETPA